MEDVCTHLVRFLERLLALQGVQLNAAIIDEWLSRYPAQWKWRTPELERMGRAIRFRTPLGLYRKDLVAISEWKAGVRNTGRLPKDEELVCQISQRAFSQSAEEKRILGLVGPQLPVKGYGFSGVGIPVASAILRFAWPDRYGCVDWRNWYVLSKVEGPTGQKNEFFTQPQLSPLANPRASLGISCKHYQTYLKILRALAECYPTRTQKAKGIVVLKELLDYTVIQIIIL